MESKKKRGPVRAPEVSGIAYLLDRLSSPSGGRATSRPSIGNAFSSILKPFPSLCGKAAPILVQRFPGLPLLSNSSTVKTFKYVGVDAGAGAGGGTRFLWAGLRLFMDGSLSLVGGVASSVIALGADAE